MPLLVANSIKPPGNKVTSITLAQQATGHHVYPALRRNQVINILHCPVPYGITKGFPIIVMIADTIKLYYEMRKPLRCIGLP